jgi:hypothetical protein
MGACMSDARVTDVAALAEFRVALVEFSGGVHRALTDIQLEVRRAMEWISVDRPAHWRLEARRGGEALAHAKDELAHSRTYKQIGDYIPACIEEKKAIEKAKRRLEIAEEKMEAVRHWTVATRHAVDEFQGPVQQLMGMLDGDIPRAIVLLERMSMALEQYATGVAPAAITWEELVGDKPGESVAQPTEVVSSSAAEKQAPGNSPSPSHKVAPADKAGTNQSNATEPSLP